MSSRNRQPFIDSRAFDKANATYVPFPSQADAMLASLQLFHDIPCRIMDLICSVVTHPGFDSKQLTLRNSVDVIDVVEEHRLKDRMVVVQKRTASGDGRVEQAGFPHFILDEVLDIIHAKRMTSIKAQFEDTLDKKAMYFDSMDIEEDDTLKAMTRVHRSWTILAQKALGRVLHIGRPTDEMDILLSPVRKSIFGPWTSAVAVQFYHPITETTEKSYDERGTDYEYEYSTDVLDEYRGWFDNLHLILVGFTNLKCLYIKSYHSLFTSWSNLTFGVMIRRNVWLEEVTLHSMPGSGAFKFNPLIENAAVLKNLRNLNLRAAWISDVAKKNAMKGPCFASLNHLAITCSFESCKDDLAILSILSSQSNPCLDSLRIVDPHRRTTSFEEYLERTFTPQQSAAIFGQLRTLHIDITYAADKWFKWIGPYCSSLESLSIIGGSNERQSFKEAVRRASSSPQSVLVFHRLRTLHIDSGEAADLWLEWIGPYCSNLESLSIIGGSNKRQFVKEAVRRASSSSQSVLVFHRLRTLHIDSETAADLWLQWIVPSCSSLESLSIRDISSLRQLTYEETVRRASSSSQSVILFDRLRTLHINGGTEADLWLKWIGPSCSSLQSVTIITLTLTPDTLNLIPVIIRSLDVSLRTNKYTTFEEITAWMKCLLKIISSMHFPKLKSFTLFISEDYIPDEPEDTWPWGWKQQRICCREKAQKFRATEMQDFKVEMSAVCEGVGVKCCFKF